MRRTRISFVVMALGLLIPAVVQAFDISEVKINGFVSQGYLYSTNNNYLADTMRNGSFEFNEVGINVHSQINDKLRVGAQLLSRDLGKDGNNEVKLDWGYADYRWKDYLGVRIGKVKLPFGMYNDGRDSDFLRPMVFLPQGVYDENKREILNAYQGIGLYGNVPLGPLGDMDYHGYIGNLNFDEDSIFVSSIRNGVTKRVTANGTNNVVLTSFDFQNDYITGGTVTFNTPLTGLKVGGSYFKVENEVDYTSTSANAALRNFSGYYSNNGAFVLSMEYAKDDLVLSGEYTEFRNHNNVFPNGAQANFTYQSYYGMLAYTFMKQFTATVLYDIFYQNLHDKDGNSWAAIGMPNYMGWRKDLGIGLRYDVNPNWTLKGEYHYVDGAGLGMTNYNAAPVGLNRYWNYVALKASYNF